MTDDSSPSKVNVAVVGLGIGRMHVLAYKELRAHFQIVAVCDVDRERAEEVAGWLRGVRAETDFDAILAADDIDVIDLCTPPNQHRVQIEAALRAGKHVICEKPLVGSLREVDEIAAIAEETSLTVMPILQYRFGRGIQKLRHLVDSGLAGRPYVANVDVAWLRGADYYEAPWRGRWETELGGVVLSHAVHAIDMTLFILGRPSGVWARLATLVNDIEVEDCAAITLRFPNGSLATMSATLGSAHEISRHRFTFEHLSAESNTEPYANGSEPWTITPSPPRSAPGIAAQPLGAAAAENDRSGEAASAEAEANVSSEDYVGQFERYAYSMANGTPLPVILGDARQVLEVVSALYQSARENREVLLPLADDDPYMNGWSPN